MAEISSALVKELRDKTGAGMMDCKKALENTAGNIEKAIEELRKSGAAKAEKRSGRAVKLGKVVAKTTGNKGVMLEMLCETDFVARNEKFTNFAMAAAERALAAAGNGDVSATVQESEKSALVELIGAIGENMQIRRAARWESAGLIVIYLHMGGRIGVMIDVEGETDQAVLNDICMHIAAYRPSYVKPSDIPADVIAKEKEIAAAQLKDKPAEMVEKIVMGKINKWHGEVCLMKQPWLRDDKTSIEKLKPGLKVNRFVRWETGEEL